MLTLEFAGISNEEHIGKDRLIMVAQIPYQKAFSNNNIYFSKDSQSFEIPRENRHGNRTLFAKEEKTETEAKKSNL